MEAQPQLPESRLIVRQNDLSASLKCEHGGLAFELGRDLDGDGKLSIAELTEHGHVEIICFDAQGKAAPEYHPVIRFLRALFNGEPSPAAAKGAPEGRRRF
jgi:hypothetical protein